MKHQAVTTDKNVARRNTYEVQKDVAMPSQRSMSHVYPFGKMEVGDSFALPKSDVRERERVRSAASYYGIRHELKFSIRIADPSANPKTYRCWRIS